MSGDLNFMLVRADEHLAGLRAEAEIERRVRGARTPRTPRVRAATGRWLIARGERLLAGQRTLQHR